MVMLTDLYTETDAQAVQAALDAMTDVQYVAHRRDTAACYDSTLTGRAVQLFDFDTLCEAVGGYSTQLDRPILTVRDAADHAAALAQRWAAEDEALFPLSSAAVTDEQVAAVMPVDFAAGPHLDVVQDAAGRVSAVWEPSASPDVAIASVHVLPVRVPVPSDIFAGENNEAAPAVLDAPAAPPAFEPVARGARETKVMEAAATRLAMRQAREAAAREARAAEYAARDAWKDAVRARAQALGEWDEYVRSLKAQYARLKYAKYR